MSGEDHKAIALEVVNILTDKGFVITTASDIDTALQLRKAQQRLMRRSKMTPYELSKFKILPGAPSLTTIKNMIADGRIKEDEHYYDGYNKLYVTRAGVERLINDL